MDRQLKDKAIDFKGSQYVLVSDRVLYFNEHHPKGCIVTKRIEGFDREVFKAIVYPDASDRNRSFTGHSQASFTDTKSFVNKTAALENAETSAVGRALGLMGIGVIDSIASADEINKAKATSNPSELTIRKNALLKELKNKDVTDLKQQIAFIESVLGKQTVDNLDEAEQVSNALKEQPDDKIS